MNSRYLLTYGLVLILTLAGSVVSVYAQSSSRVVWASGESSQGIDSEIWIMNDDGTNKTQLTNNDFEDVDPVLCGSKIFFSSDRDGSFDIWSMQRDGSGPTNVTPGGPGDDREPGCHSFLPIIVFKSNRESVVPNLYRVNSDGSYLLRLTAHEFEDESPKWCGNEIIFARNLFLEAPCVGSGGAVTNPGTDYQIFIMAETGELCPGCSPARALTCANNVLPSSQPPGCAPTPLGALLTYWPTCHLNVPFSPGGAQFAFSGYKPAIYNAREIFRSPLFTETCDDESPSPIQLTVTANDEEDDYPSWSPAGGWITFASDRLEQNERDWEIYKMNAKDGEFMALEQLTMNQVDDENPDWKEIRSSGP